MANIREQCKKISDKNAHIKCTYSTEWSEFRVTLDGLSEEREEAVAYYTTDFQDAWDTAVAMSDRRTFELA